MKNLNLNVLTNKFEEEFFKSTKSKLPKKISVCVSGGADSMLLAYLIKETFKYLDVKLYAFTVDHQLRKASTKEANFVHEQLSKLGFEHKILTWEGKKPKTKIEETARKKRYELIFKECKKEKIKYIATAHHKDDQIETLLMRFLKGSGADGLCGITDNRIEKDIHIIRPMLYLSKEKIIKICKKNKIKWIEDKSNNDTKFTRNKIRKLCSFMKKNELLTDEILLTKDRALLESQALNNIAKSSFDKMTEEKNNSLIFNKKDFFNLETEIQLRFLQLCLNHFKPTIYTRKRKALLTVLNKLKQNKGSTLNKCFIKTSKGNIVVKKEK